MSTLHLLVRATVRSVLAIALLALMLPTAAAAQEVTPALLGGPTTVPPRGDAFADALAAGPHAGAIDGPIVLTDDPNALSDATRDHLDDPPGEIDAIRAVGGPEAITPGALATAVGIVGAGAHRRPPTRPTSSRRRRP